MALLYNFGILFFLPLILIGILFFIFWIIMLVDCITRKFKDSNDKLIWVLVNIFAGLLGSLIYYFVVYKKDKTKSIKWFWITLLILVILFVILLILLLFALFNQGVLIKGVP